LFAIGLTSCISALGAIYHLHINTFTQQSQAVLLSSAKNTSYLLSTMEMDAFVLTRLSLSTVLLSNRLLHSNSYFQYPTWLCLLSLYAHKLQLSKEWLPSWRF